MREHPIPTDITNYRFHIIGTMTLKQFGEVALGIIFAFLINFTNLPVVIKWPLIVFSVGLGAAAAFIPIAERPLDHWITTFFRALYKPTQFYWKRTERIPEPFLFKPRDNEAPVEEEFDLTPYKRQRIKEYLHSVPTETTYGASFTEDETVRMQSILDSFSTTPVTVSPTTPIREHAVKPSLSVRVRDIRAPETNDSIPQTHEQIFNAHSTIPDLSTVPNVSQSHELPQTEGFSLPLVSSILEPESMQQDITANPIEINPDEVIQVTAPIHEMSQTQNTQMQPQYENLHTQADSLHHHSLPDLPEFPNLPLEPNKIVGMVITRQNELIPEAIVEVKNQQGEVQRAVKTNALGQFFITTPLLDGEYTITVEKESLTFEPYQIMLNGQIIRPITIQSL
ncbi:MAG: hypothetical protein WAU07_00325 [Microgenomates group bacterium]